MNSARLALWPLSGFVLVLVVVQLRALEPLDRAITAVVQTTVDCRLAGLSNVADLLFSAESSVVICLAASTLLFRAGFGRYALVPWLVFLSLPVEIGAKFLVTQPGPPEPSWPALAGCPRVYPLLNPSVPNSFPSGYSIRMAYFAVLLSAFLPDRPFALPMRWLVGLTVAVLAWERVYLGGHWPSDVGGGLLLGIALGFISVALLAQNASESPGGPGRLNGGSPGTTG